MKISYTPAHMTFSWIFLAVVSIACAAEDPPPSAPPGVYAGSQSCRECHERFHGLWSTSMHSLAMQPFTKELARERITAPARPVRIKDLSYQADLSTGEVVEIGAGGEERYRCETRVLGGTVIHRDSVLSAAERAEGKKMMVCVSRGKGRLTLDI